MGLQFKDHQTTNKLLTVVCTPATTVLIDSAYWRQPFLWPELYSIYYNVVLGKSADWGISPPGYYLKHLPLLLMSTLPLMAYTCAHPVLRRKAQLDIVLLPMVGMVGGMSMLGHKEWRFVCYVVVWGNVLGALAASHLSVQHFPLSFLKEAGLYLMADWMDVFCMYRWNRREKSWMALGMAWLVIGGVCANVVATVGLTIISAGNYPGGEIMRALHQVEGGKNATGEFCRYHQT